jgi:two-component system, OmpR family, response regulator MprA
MQGAPNNQARILVIDDDLELQQGLKTALEGEGYEMVSAAHGAEGWKETEMGHPDLILLDLMMPEMNGFEFMEKISEAAPEIASIPVVVLTAADRRLLDDPRLDNAAHILTKPFDLGTLLNVLLSLARRHRAAG